MAAAGPIMQPARGPPADFFQCGYCERTFANASGCRSHENSDMICLLRAAEGGNSNKDPRLDSHRVEGALEDAYPNDGGGFEGFLDSFADAQLNDPKPDPPEANRGAPGESAQPAQDPFPFNSVNELILAFQEAGRRNRPLGFAGMDRLLRVINHPKFRSSEIARALPSAREVTKLLGTIALGTVSVF